MLLRVNSIIGNKISNCRVKFLTSITHLLHPLIDFLSLKKYAF